ncbi:MAG: hypothetical protein ACRC50_06020 [Gaiella sp.]
MASPPTAVRVARNESILREVNEHLEAAAASARDGHASFVCECSDLACAELLTMPLAEYERVRSHAGRFIVAPADEHVHLRHEVVVERHEDFWVVEKCGAAGAAAEALDPRS